MTEDQHFTFCVSKILHKTVSELTNLSVKKRKSIFFVLACQMKTERTPKFCGFLYA